ncbi:VC2046/SO_2500 family protein [Vibrio sp. WXL103]|uniref:VC2046/SO_2500 family protein n=1 Tax=unclassified Vibrio TaxID=2614977 RepID=UPI003EC51C83
MQVTTLDNSIIINELQTGGNINRAVHEGRRADFALFLSMFSDDIREVTPVDSVEETITSDDLLRRELQLATPQPLRSDSASYDVGSENARQFQQGGMASSKLNHYLTPEALAYLPEHTHDLPEEVYHNLSHHQQRRLNTPDQKAKLPHHFYHQMNEAHRRDQLSLHA